MFKRSNYMCFILRGSSVQMFCCTYEYKYNKLCVCVCVCRDTKIANHYNGEFLGFCGVYFYFNCQKRNKDLYKPVVLKVTSADSWGTPRPPGQNHFHNNIKHINCFFHSISICLDGSKVTVGKTAGILLEVAPNYTSSHYIITHSPN